MRTATDPAGAATALVDQLETVIAIPPLPFRAGNFDAEAHRKNMRFLVERNFLDGGRRRAIGIAGTSLIHHVDEDTLVEAVRIAGEVAGQEAIVIAGLVATPPAAARRYVRRCLGLRRAPDFVLLMPIPGVCNAAGIGREFLALARECGERDGARFLLYMRDATLIQIYASLLMSSDTIVGVKIGTRAADVARMRALVPEAKKVLWGVGDRATEAASMGARGHTSGITLVCPRACDEINNAYRREDFARAGEVEGVVAELEEIRFAEQRAYNYSAVVAAARLCGFTDVDLGDGGPYNADPPADVLSRIAGLVETLKEYH